MQTFWFDVSPWFSLTKDKINKFKSCPNNGSAQL